MKGEKLGTSHKYVHYAKVTGNEIGGYFDMSRYDRCHVWKESMSSKLAGLRYGHEPVTVVVVQYGGVTPNWTPDRWKSFGWQCEPITLSEAYCL